jgi:hypothetical protein
MNNALRYQMLFAARCEIRNACNFTDKHGVAHGLQPAEMLELLQTIHAAMAKNTGHDDMADRLLDLIADFDGELHMDAGPELEGFRTIEPRTLDQAVSA